MCRIFAYIGDSTTDLEKLVVALRDASSKDVVAEKAGLRKIVHPDGWGYAIYSEKGLSFHKSGKPLQEEHVELPEIKGKSFAIFHARLASDPSSVGDRFSHPFFADTPESFVFFSHNGSVDEKRLRNELRFKGISIDSELAFKYILQNGIENGSKRLEDYTEKNSALNIMILELPRAGEPKLYVKHYYNKDTNAMHDKTEYYALLFQKMKGGVAMFSSTMNYYGMSGRRLEEIDCKPFIVLD